MQAILVKDQDHNALTYSALFLGIALYSAVFGYYTCISHYQLHTRAYDLGINVNYFWNTWFNDEFMRCSYCFNVPDFYYLYDHVELLPVFIIGPFFKLFPHAETLLIAQSILLGLGALPIFLIAKHLLKNNSTGLVLAACYLLNPAVQSANFYDFHQLSFLPLVYGFMIYFILKGSRFYYLSLICLLLMKEDMVIVATLFSLFLLLHFKRYRTAGLTMLISLGWLLALNLFIQGDAETFNHYFYFSELVSKGGTLGELVANIFLDPLNTLSIIFRAEKMIFLFQMLLPFLFLPLMGARYLFLFVYGASLSLLSSHAPLYQMGFQYSFYWLTGLAVAYIFVLSDIKQGLFEIYKKLNYRYILFLTLFCTLGLNIAYGAFSGDGFKTAYHTVEFEYSQEDEERYRCFQSLVETHIPPQASVVADEVLTPHLSTRAKIESVRFFLNKRKFEYIVLIERDSRPYFQFLRYLRRLGSFEEIASECGFVVYKNNSSRRAPVNQSWDQF